MMMHPGQYFLLRLVEAKKDLADKEVEIRSRDP